MIQRLPGHGGISDFWIMAQLQPVRRAGMGLAAPRGHHQGHPLPSEGLDKESLEHGAGNRVKGGLLGCVRGKEKNNDDGYLVMSADVDFIPASSSRLLVVHGLGEARLMDSSLALVY